MDTVQIQEVLHEHLYNELVIKGIRARILILFYFIEVQQRRGSPTKP